MSSDAGRGAADGGEPARYEDAGVVRGSVSGQAGAALEDGTREPSWSDRRRRSLFLNEVLAELPGEQRAVVVSVYLAGHSQSEVALELELPLQTVRRRLFLGLHHIGTAIATSPTAP